MELLHEGVRLKLYQGLSENADQPLDAGTSPMFFKRACSDIVSSTDITLRSAALKCIGFLLSRQQVPEDMVSHVLDAIIKAALSSHEQVIHKLSMWCLSVQHLHSTFLESRMENLVAAVVHVVNNGSVSVQLESSKAIQALGCKLPRMTRKLSHVWARPFYIKLVSSIRADRDAAREALFQMLPTMQPCTDQLSKLVAEDLTENLLSELEKLSVDHTLSALNSWKCFAILLERHLLQDENLFKNFFKTPQRALTSSSAQVRRQALAAWECLITAFIPDSTCRIRAKYLRLLLLPVLICIRHNEPDSTVKVQSWRMFTHLLNALGERLHDHRFFKRSMLPLIRDVVGVKDLYFQRSCVQVVERYASACLPVPPDFSRLDVPVSDVFKPSGESCVEFQPWTLCSLCSLLAVVRAFWDSALTDGDQTSWKLSAAVRVWYVTLKSVEAELKDCKSPSAEQVKAVHALLSFVDEICTSGADSRSWSWSFIKVLLDELGSTTLISRSFERQSLWQQDHAFGSTQMRPAKVLPVVYVVQVWLKMVTLEEPDSSEVDDISSRTKALLLKAFRGGGFDPLQGIQEQLSCVRWLLSRYEESEVKVVTRLTAISWSGASKQLKDYLEDTGEVSSGSSYVCDTLLLAVECFYVQDLDTGSDSVKPLWSQLLDASCRLLSFKTGRMDSFLSVLYQRLVEVIDRYLILGKLPRRELIVDGVLQALRLNTNGFTITRKSKRRSSTAAGTSVREVMLAANRLLTIGATSETSCITLERLLDALTCYSNQVSNQPEVLHFLHSIEKPFECLLTRKLFTRKLVHLLSGLSYGLRKLTDTDADGEHCQESEYVIEKLKRMMAAVEPGLSITPVRSSLKRQRPKSHEEQAEKKKVRFDDLQVIPIQPSTECVLTEHQKEVKDVLTEHQKEVKEAQRKDGVGVKTYTAADFSLGPETAQNQDGITEVFQVRIFQ